MISIQRSHTSISHKNRPAPYTSQPSHQGLLGITGTTTHNLSNDKYRGYGLLNTFSFFFFFFQQPRSSSASAIVDDPPSGGLVAKPGDEGSGAIAGSAAQLTPQSDNPTTCGPSDQSQAPQHTTQTQSAQPSTTSSPLTPVSQTQSLTPTTKIGVTQDHYTESTKVLSSSQRQSKSSSVHNSGGLKIATQYWVEGRGTQYMASGGDYMVPTLQHQQSLSRIDINDIVNRIDPAPLGQRGMSGHRWTAQNQADINGYGEGVASAGRQEGEPDERPTNQREASANSNANRQVFTIYFYYKCKLNQTRTKKTNKKNNPLHAPFYNCFKLVKFSSGNM